jgi:hypothetical protein
MAQKRRNPPTAIGGSETICDELAARHEPQIASTVPSAQVARRRLRPGHTTPLEEKWRITKRLAALRCADRTVMAIEVGAKVSKVYILHHPDDHWVSRVNAGYTYYSQVARAFIAPVVAEILFAEKPPLKYREWDYGKFGPSIESSGSRSQEDFAKACLQETFDTLIRERVAVVRITHALLERESVSGEEVAQLLKSNTAMEVSYK